MHEQLPTDVLDETTGTQSACLRRRYPTPDAPVWYCFLQDRPVNSFIYLKYMNILLKNNLCGFAGGRVCLQRHDVNPSLGSRPQTSMFVTVSGDTPGPRRIVRALRFLDSLSSQVVFL